MARPKHPPGPPMTLSDRRQQGDQQMLWEYRIMSLPTQKEPQEAQEALNSLGDSGWELVFAYPTRDAVNYVFKKPKQYAGQA